MAQYSDDFKANVVAAVTAAGWPDNPYKLAEVAREYHVPVRTARRWCEGGVGAPPPPKVAESKKDMAGALEIIAWRIITHLDNPDIISKLPAKDAATVLGILIDKMRLLRGLPTEIVALMPDVVTALDRLGQNPVEVFERIIQRAAELDEHGH